MVLDKIECGKITVDKYFDVRYGSEKYFEYIGREAYRALPKLLYSDDIDRFMAFFGNVNEEWKGITLKLRRGDEIYRDAYIRMRKKHNLLIGERTAEDIKIKIGTCYPLAQNETMDVRGRNLVTGLPRTITVSSEETEEALREATLQIVEAVHAVLEKTPPELAADVADRGIVLTGGGSLLRGLEELIEEKTGINTMTAEQPMTCVAIGTGKYVEFLAGKRDDE